MVFQLNIYIRTYLYSIHINIFAGRNLYPATGYLYLVWESLDVMRSQTSETFSVVFENVKFLRATNIPTGPENLQLIVMIQRGTGNFEVCTLYCTQIYYRQEKKFAII